MIGEELHRALVAPEIQIAAACDNVELVSVLEEAPAYGCPLQPCRGAVEACQAKDVFSAIHTEASDPTHSASVQIPRMSTALLPLANGRVGGHSTAMELREILERIERRLEATGLSERAASEKAGKPDAIRNLRRALEKDGRQGVSTATLNALAPVLGTTSVWLFAGAGPEEPAKAPSSGSTSISSAAGGEEIVQATQPAVRVLYGGFVEAGSYREISEFIDVPPEDIFLPPDSEYPRVQQVAFDVRGDSMNALTPRPILRGDRVVALDFEGLHGRVALHTGMVVIVQQSREGGHLVERSVKQLEVYEDRYEFHPRSTVSRYKPIVVPHSMEADDGREVRILAWARSVLNKL
ncbi:hypothetical protein Mnod_4241 [Methylobacterium nodulans ORS 2060]|uniref:Peptidase S24/S26A/S26B/S26C domain-containing protein n=2 Tax=Methylobacterium nodulans TaxID=114616 RepID=B8IA54_METNO|nr:hypothetical protein Mnod_4241 [Methylobacterium nodulans ORS 2060]